jgi:hypothetical protein
LINQVILRHRQEACHCQIVGAAYDRNTSYPTDAEISACSHKFPFMTHTMTNA